MRSRDFHIHKKFMRIALKEAKRGAGKVEPNPLVGCVIVNNDKAIAKGFHNYFGGDHAEIMAIKKAGKKAAGATLYVTLEPCAHYGKTPPCADAIIKSGIKKVVVAMLDPNPAVNGKGVKRLRDNNIDVVTGVLINEAEKLSKDFACKMRRKMPCVTLKLAQSIDGKIATRRGDSKWISSEASRRLVHRLRGKNDAVMVGVNTLLNDNPLLSNRISSFACLPAAQVHRASSRQPVKIIVDSRLRTPPEAKIFSKASPGRVIIVAAKNASREKELLLRKKGAEIIRLKADNRGVDLGALMKELIKRGIVNILVEGGGELAASLLEKRLVDRLYFFIAPLLIGGRDAVTSFEGKGVDRVNQAFKLKRMSFKRIGKDILVEGDVYRNN